MQSLSFQGIMKKILEGSCREKNIYWARICMQNTKKEDRVVPFHWTYAPPPAAENAQQVFTDCLSYINKIFLNLGYSETDNHLLHGTQAHAKNMRALYGASRNKNAYPNRFDIIEGKRGYYHPYRSNPNTNLMTAKEELHQPFIAIPSASYIFGYNGPHGPEGMTYGTLPYIQRDFILEYLEWRYANKHNVKAKPWVFGFGIHPHQLLEDSLDTRRSLELFFKWINSNFATNTVNYATLPGSSDKYIKWERVNAGTNMYRDINPEQDGVQADIKTWRIHNAVKNNNLHYTATRKIKSTEIYELADKNGLKAMLIIPGKQNDVKMGLFFQNKVDCITVSTTEIGIDPKNIVITEEPVLLVTHHQTEIPDTK